MFAISTYQVIFPCYPPHPPPPPPPKKILWPLNEIFPLYMLDLGICTFKICLDFGIFKTYLGFLRQIRFGQMYTDGQKKRYSKILSCIACGSQTQAAQAYQDQNLESSLGAILICRFRLPGMLAKLHVYILTYFTIFFLLNNLSQILDV